VPSANYILLIDLIDLVIERIRGYFYNEMRYINLRFTYLLTC